MSFDSYVAAMWAAVEEAGVMTGAWTGIAFADIPPEVRKRFEESVSKVIERILEENAPDDYDR